MNTRLPTHCWCPFCCISDGHSCLPCLCRYHQCLAVITCSCGTTNTVPWHTDNLPSVGVLIQHSTGSLFTPLPSGEMDPVQSELSKSLRIWPVHLALPCFLQAVASRSTSSDRCMPYHAGEGRRRVLHSLLCHSATFTESVTPWKHAYTHCAATVLSILASSCGALSRALSW